MCKNVVVINCGNSKKKYFLNFETMSRTKKSSNALLLLSFQHKYRLLVLALILLKNHLHWWWKTAPKEIFFIFLTLLENIRCTYADDETL